MKSNFLRGFLATVAAVLVSASVIAAMNLRQNPDGSADFVRDPSGNAYKVGRHVIQAQFADIATASNVHVASPIAGRITAWYSVINNAITNANCVLTLTYNDDWVNVSTITVTQSGSAAGDFDSATGLTLAVTAGGKIRLTSDGGCDTTTVTPIQVFVDPS